MAATKVCEWCSKRYRPTRPNQRACSRRCGTTLAAITRGWTPRNPKPSPPIPTIGKGPDKPVAQAGAVRKRLAEVIECPHCKRLVILEEA